MVAARASTALAINRTDHLLFVFVTPVATHFAMAVLGKKPSTLVWSLYAFSIALQPLTLTSVYLPRMASLRMGYFGISGWASTLFGGVATVVLVYCAVLLFRAYRHEPEGEQRSRLLWLAIVYPLTAALTVGNLGVLHGLSTYPTSAFLFLPSLGFGYSVLRHDMVRIDHYTRSVLVRGAITGLVVLGYAVLLGTVVVLLKPVSMDRILRGVYPYGLPALLTVLVSALLAWISLRAVRQQRELLLFAVNCVIFSALNLDVVLQMVLDDPAVALTLARLQNAAFMGFQAAVGLHLTYTLVQHTRHRWALYALYGLAVVSIPFVAFTDLALVDTKLFYWGYFAQGGVLFRALSAVWFVVMVFAMTLQVRAYLVLHDVGQRWRLRMYLGGWSASVVLSFGNVPAMNGYGVYPLGTFAFLPLVVMGYGLLRGELREALRLLRTVLLWAGMLLGTMVLAFVSKGGDGSYGRSFFFALVIPAALVLWWRFSRSLLGVFFGQREEELHAAIGQLTDQLSQAHNATTLVDVLAAGLFRWLDPRSVTLLLEVPTADVYFGTSQQHHQGGLSLAGNQSSKLGDRLLPRTHFLVQVLQEEHKLMRQEDLAKALTDRHITLPSTDWVMRVDCVLPVFFKNDLVAVLAMGTKNDGSAYDSMDLNFLQRLGVSLAPLIKHVQLLENLEETVAERTEELGQLNAVARKVNATLDLEQVLGTISDALHLVFPFDQLAVELLDEATKTLVFRRSLVVNVPSSSTLHRPSTTRLRIATTALEALVPSQPPPARSSTLVDLEGQRSSLLPPTHNVLRSKGYLMCPLEVHGVVVGRITFASRKGPLVLGQEQLAKVRRYIPQIATAVNNARLYETLRTTRAELAETEKVAAMTRTFEKFVPRQFLRRVAKDGLEHIALGVAETEELTMLFSDLRSFTSLSERLAPQELLNFLNAYFRRMNRAVRESHGFVDKFIGDAVLALFDRRASAGAALHADDAVCAAIAMQRAVEDYNKGHEERPIASGIGLHTGSVVIGTVGAEDRMDSTVLGDAVNVASRLESLSKRYGASILVSGQTLERVRSVEEYAVREIDCVRVVGREAPVQVYEVCGCHPEPLRRSKLEAGRYLAEALTLRREGDWARALVVLQQGRLVEPTDMALRAQLRQCSDESRRGEGGAVELGEK
jgi:class 3 adenylate cyclase